jgi:hydroxymethylglutaryl-CoA reductase
MTKSMVDHGPHRETAVYHRQRLQYSGGMKRRGNSRLPGFHRLAMAERRRLLAELIGDGAPFPGEGLPDRLADALVENAVGVFGVPLGVAANFVVNGADVLVPMAVEEPSVIAAASNAARMARAGGGFAAEADAPLTVAQIELREPSAGAAERIGAAATELLALADATQPELIALGGGAREIAVRREPSLGDRLIVHVVVDCRDAMGANTVNTMAEALSSRLADLAGAGAGAGLRILTNLADRRLARARVAIPLEALGREGFDGAAVAAGVAAACDFAAADPYRAATHNKGIFNGIDALLLATGNDWRAVEAGGHAFAARGGRYAPLSSWRVDGGTLRGKIELPMAVGIVGGASRSHPTARRCLELLGVETASELAMIAVSVGLAQNLAALTALAAEGIQAGHMRLHARRNDRQPD